MMNIRYTTTTLSTMFLPEAKYKEIDIYLYFPPIYGMITACYAFVMKKASKTSQVILIQMKTVKKKEKNRIWKWIIM